MNPDTCNRLIELNHQFYQTFAQPFADTRQRLQPGVKHLLAEMPDQSRVLDIGCGNGEIGRSLLASGRASAYLGLDFSIGLLHSAAAGLSSKATKSAKKFELLHFDLAYDDWELIRARGPFDLAVAFAVLHHLPGEELRLATLRNIRSCLTSTGLFYHSEWQFLKSTRLRARIQPWEAIGLSPDQVEEGDYLLDWRRGGRGLRYVHHFTPTELASLAERSGFQIRQTFYSDGETHDLSIYQVWEVCNQ
ncbi:MAG: class I SAM-dependent methyltransferase [Anaerolineales bacterium]|nr:class I SAM-dependent methyltransferase [Anaerolineales bacterium]